MSRAWVELPRDYGWGDIRLAVAAMGKLGYVTEELRGTRGVMLRLSGTRLDVSELWRMPGQG